MGKGPSVLDQTIDKVRRCVEIPVPGNGAGFGGDRGKKSAEFSILLRRHLVGHISQERMVGRRDRKLPYPRHRCVRLELCRETDGWFQKFQSCVLDQGLMLALTLAPRLVSRRVAFSAMARQRAFP